jgi:hypothetical protein
VIEPNRRRITGSISYKPLISDISVLIVCNKTGGTIKGDIKKIIRPSIRNFIKSMSLRRHVFELRQVYGGGEGSCGG